MTLSPTSWPGGPFASGAHPSCVLQKTGNLDIHAVANYPLLWSALADDVWNANPLTAIPSGLGLTFAFNGTSATITTTEAGVWSFLLFVAVAAADATWRGSVSDSIGLITTTVEAAVGPGSHNFQAFGQGALPVGAAGGPNISTVVAATANPFNLISASLVITRLG